MLLDQKLISELVKAVVSPERWENVLTHMMWATGAGAAMITLRDSQTCQIVDDTALEATYHSPLVCGFSEESAIYYLKELREIDPWAKAQRAYYPHHPVPMSRICDPADQPGDKFFDWLRMLGFNETIVFELDRMPGYWTALNLFVEEPDSPGAKVTLSYAECHAKVLRDVWSASQAVIQSGQSIQATLAAIAESACIVDHSGELLAHNACFAHLLDRKYVNVVGQRKRLSFADSIVIDNTHMLPKLIARHVGGAEQMRAVATEFDPDPLHKGKRTKHYLITVHAPGARSSSTDLGSRRFDTLSGQERKMLVAVRSGLSVQAAGTQVGVKRTRAFEIWASVKTKMSIGNAYQVRKT